MFLYVHMLSICSDMSDMFVCIRFCFRSCIGLIMLLIVFSIRFCYVLAMSVLTQYLYRFVSDLSRSLYQSHFRFRFRVIRLVCV
ncbi:hypothetical protein HanRHA438_Chr11g0508031 [Helianthus annuus]|nr:hypothetical protein HanIR_Chr11g0533411 [Helianthus annuus]KAJ0871074.1 hypothetical protein HanRHA438_Chr11g0508031 [Helianthus annuus]